MLVIRSTVFYIFFISWCIISPIIFSPALFMNSTMVLAAAHAWAKGSLFLLKIICGLDHEFIDTKKLPKDRNFIIASKHQSAWDTMIFFLLLKRPVYILKKELIYTTPLISFYMIRLDSIAVDRKGKAKALRKMVKDSVDRFNEGRQVIIFPEGTRTLPGVIKPYQPGVAAIYKQANCTVVPIALNSGFFWSRNSLLKKPGRITLQVLDPIEPGLKIDEFMEKLQGQIQGASQKLADKVS